MSLRLPVGPLLARAPSVCELARRIDVTPRTIHRWQHDGVPLLAADRAAIALGHHPADLWPTDYWKDTCLAHHDVA